MDAGLTAARDWQFVPGCADGGASGTACSSQPIQAVQQLLGYCFFPTIIIVPGNVAVSCRVAVYTKNYTLFTGEWSDQIEWTARKFSNPDG